MSQHNVIFDAKNYMNIQGLGNLKAQSKTDPKLARHEVAQQFESLLVQMLIKSMRDANKAFGDSKEMGSSQEMYQDLFDKQVALSISQKGMGFGDAVERFLTRGEPAQTSEVKPVSTELPRQTTMAAQRPFHTVQPVSLEEKSSAGEKPETKAFNSEIDFVKNLWGEAKKAAASLGVDPKLLMAQAVLETGWGKRVIPEETQGSSHNLFNIKADPAWDKKFVQVDTLEERDGLVSKEKGAFRVYDDYAESFQDYVHFIKSNPRYQEALKSTANPSQYIQKLQEANYATDSRYSDKVMEIYNGDRLNSLVELAEA